MKTTLRTRISQIVLLVLCAILVNVASDALKPVPLEAQAPTNVATPAFNYSNINTVSSAANVIKARAGVLHSISVTSAGTGSSFIYLYDHATTTGTSLIARIDGLVPNTYVFDIFFGTGLTWYSTGTLAPNVVVSYR